MKKSFARIALAALPAAVVLALAFQVSTYAGSTMRWDGLKPGPYAVGFRAEGTRDETRSFGRRKGYDGTLYKGDLGRPVEVLVWYPAERAAGAEAMQYGDYVVYRAFELDFRPLTPERKGVALSAYEAMLTGLGAGRGDVGKLLEERTSAVSDAVPAVGSFPVIVYAPSFGSDAFENFILCEFLASHGYIVAASPSVGAQAREMTQDAAGLQAQVRDVEFLIGFMRSYPNADIDRLGVAGFSWGGLADVVAALDDARVGAVVSLDGSIRSKRGLEVARYSPSFAPDNLRVPFLLMLSGQPAGVETVRDLSFYDALKYSDACLLTLKSLQHRNFASQFTLEAGLVPRTAKETNTPAVTRGYEAVCDYALNFFDAHLKGLGQAAAYLARKPAANGFPVDVASLTCRKALKAPPTEGQFLKILVDEGPRRGKEIWKQVEKDNPSYRLFKEATLNRLGYDLLQHREIAKAIGVFELNTQAFPNSANTYDSLGEAYLRAGNLAAAETSYRKALGHLAGDPALDDAARTMMRRHIESMLAEIQRRKTGGGGFPDR